jgi:phage terminase small subunit
MSAIKLRPKQERFCQEYVLDMNGTRAAIRAGYSESTANEQASRLLAKDNVSARVLELKEKQAKRLEISADTILRELLALATADVTDALDDAGNVKPIKELPKELRRALSSIDVSEVYVGEGEEKHVAGLRSRYRFHDKNKALELLGKHLKLFADRIEHSGKDGGPIETKNLSDVPDGELDAKIQALLSKRGGNA